VLPASFDYYGVGNANNDLFLPLGHLADNEYMRDRDSHPVRVLGRMKQGATLEQARADLSAIAASLAQEYPASNRNVGVAMQPLLDDYVGDVRLTLAVLLAAALLVLVVASANIANLLLARAAARRREIAVRLALGAGRLRVMRQLITESLVLSMFGGALGVVAGTSAARLLDHIAPNSLPRLTEVQIDVRVVAFSIAVTVLAGLAFGAAPAFQASGVDLRRFLGEGGRGLAPRSRRLREALVVAQMALCIALVVGAGLLVRSYAALLRADPGYDAEHVTTMRIRLPDGRYRDRARVLSVLDEALAKISSMRGVERAALTTGVPLGRGNDERYAVDGEPAVPRERAPVALAQWVTPDYFQTLRIALVAGRYFTPADREDGVDVAIVDEEFSARTFPGEARTAALGRRVQLAGEKGRWREIVGVVRHVRHAALDEIPRAEVYAPFDQMDPGWQLEIGRAMDVAIRSRDGSSTIVAGVREQLRAIDPELPLSHIRTMEDALAISMAPRSFTLTLLGMFAVVAVVLCVVGLYGVTSYAVTQRTREIGIRVALGARPQQVVALLMGRGARVIAAGVVLGLAAAIACGRVLQDLLYGVQPGDPVTFTAAAALLCVVAAIASYLPARRATRLDPVVAMRND
jgi:putative ABC transport system permease protein